jgi:hypothetical protein
VLIQSAMAVAPPSHSARDYVRAFDLTCIALWRDGRLGVSRNPTGADQAWWCPAKAAGALVRAAEANGKDVAQAAARLKTPLTDHATVAQRATEAVDRIDCTLNAARLRGDLVFFNGAYKARRQAAQAAGRGFMSYGVALRKAIASVAANGGAVTRSLMASVFDDVEP